MIQCDGLYVTHTHTDLYNLSDSGTDCSVNYYFDV